MKKESGITIHIGISFITTPPLVISKQKFIEFQNAIITNGLDFTRSEHLDNVINLLRTTESSLNISVINDQPNNIGQLTIISTSKIYVNHFIKEVESVINAFKSVWSESNRLIIRCDVTIRELHETSSQHAFKEIWEDVLGQKHNSLKIFGKPILGGGLRFVFPPLPDDPEHIQIEVKIESFLENPKKIFVDTQFVWFTPDCNDPLLNAGKKIMDVKNYLDSKVIGFLSGGQNVTK